MVFEIDKWYLDCVADDGRAALLYWAALRRGLLRLRYGACLVGGAPDVLTPRYTLRPDDAPRDEGDSIRWACDAIGVAGTWLSAEVPIERTLFAAPEGEIRWCCAGPRAAARVRVGSHVLEGTGYVERLQMSLAPWRLPFTALRWGRFHGAGHTVIWIDWNGGLERTWVFVDGVERRDARVEAHGIVLGCSDRLDIEVGATLREGPLERTALRPLGVAAALFPHRWRARETKWLSPAWFDTSGKREPGWAVHEEVRW